MTLTFVPNVRFVRILALASPLWLLAVLFPGGWIPAVGMLGLLFVLCWREAMGFPHTSELTFCRVFPPRFSLGEERVITLVITSRARVPLRLRIRDGLPEALSLKAAMPMVEVPAGGKVACAYPVEAVRRGAHDFGNLVVRVQYGSGLLLKELAICLADRVKVYPRFRGVDDYDLLARIDERDEVVRKPRHLRGARTDFESLRSYIPGEDLRAVDWKASARRGSLISRNRQVEKGQQVAVLLDAGRLMGETEAGFSKLDHAMNAAIMLGHVVQRRGDTMALGCFSNRIESFLPPLRGRRIVPRIMDALYAVEARSVESDYWQVIAEAMGMLRRRSLVIMLTDVLDSISSAGLINNLRRAASKHLVLCVVFNQPRVVERARTTPGNLAETYQKAAALDLLRRRELALESMRARGILVLETDPGRLSVQLVRSYLEIRKGDLQ